MTHRPGPWLAAAVALPLLGCGEKPPARAVSVPVGTALTVALKGALSSETSRAGDLVVATLIEPLAAEGVTLAPAGTELRGRVTTARAAGKLKGRAQLAFQLEEIVLGGKSHPISARVVGLAGASQTKKNSVAIGVGTGAGTVVGAIAGGKKGAAIGAAVGAAAGTGAAAIKGGEQVVVPAGQPVNVELTAPLSVS